MKGDTKKGPVEADLTRTVEITACDTAVEVPDGAKKLLDAQS